MASPGVCLSFLPSASARILLPPLHFLLDFFTFFWKEPTHLCQMDLSPKKDSYPEGIVL